MRPPSGPTRLPLPGLNISSAARFAVRARCCRPRFILGHGSPPKTRTPAIEAWRATLDDAKKRTLNHPGGAVWHAWRRTTTERPSQHRQNVVQGAESHKGGGYGRAIHWPQTALKRAAEAIREARSGNCIVLARKALEAAIRNENDLLALLPDDLPATSTAQRTTEKNGAQPTHAAA